MTESTGRDKTRATIVEVAARLLREKGARAVTTRAVAQAAGLQAPTIYRFFEDKEALLDAVAEHVMATYTAAKTPGDSTDPAADLRSGWDMHIGFGLANPDVFGLITDPARATRSPAMASGLEVLRARMHRLAEAGRLRVTEQRAVELIHSAGTGTVLTLLATPPEDRDTTLADTMYAAVAQAILTDAPAETPTTEFRTLVPTLPMLTEAERTLLTEWLNRTDP